MSLKEAKVNSARCRGSWLIPYTFTILIIAVMETIPTPDFNWPLAFAAYQLNQILTSRNVPSTSNNQHASHLCLWQR